MGEAHYVGLHVGNATALARRLTRAEADLAAAQQRLAELAARDPVACLPLLLGDIAAWAGRTAADIDQRIHALLGMGPHDPATHLAWWELVETTDAGQATATGTLGAWLGVGSVTITGADRAVTALDKTRGVVVGQRAEARWRQRSGNPRVRAGATEPGRLPGPVWRLASSSAVHTAARWLPGVSFAADMARDLHAGMGVVPAVLRNGGAAIGASYGAQIGAGACMTATVKSLGLGAGACLVTVPLGASGGARAGRWIGDKAAAGWEAAEDRLRR